MTKTAYISNSKMSSFFIAFRIPGDPLRKITINETRPHSLARNGVLNSILSHISPYIVKGLTLGGFSLDWSVLNLSITRRTTWIALLSSGEPVNNPLQF
jgi:hypothetical protein